MRIKTLIIFYYWLCLICGCAQKTLRSNTSSFRTLPNQKMGLHILSYNIHHANPPSRPNFIDLEAIGKVIREQTPDLVALQEVDVYTNRSGKASHQAAELAKLSGMPYYYFAKAIDYDGGEYGVAILSRLPMEAMKNISLPTAAETKGEPRTLATAIIRLPHNKEIVFACTHLDAQNSDTNRLLQINKIVEILQQEKLPVLIAGDFNAIPSTRIINQVDQHFKRSCLVDCGFTVPVNNPTKTIDFVAHKPAGEFTVSRHEIIDEKYASDHLPVKVVLHVK